MAKYSKAASQSVKKTVRKMKQGKLTSGTSGKKVTSKKQAVAIGLSEAREKGAQVPARKKTIAAKKSAAKKTAPRKAAAKKSSSPAKKKTAAKKTSTGKAAAKKSSPPMKKKSSPKEQRPAKNATTKRGSSKTGNKANKAKPTPSDVQMARKPVTNTHINNTVTPEATDEVAVFVGTQPEQDWIPEGQKASPHDPYHGNVNPSKAKTNIKPSGKKPLWDSRK